MYWKRQISEHGFRVILITGLLYTCVFGYLWLTTGRAQFSAVPSSKANQAAQHFNNRTGDSNEFENNDLAFDPERWKKRPLPNYKVMTQGLKVLTPEEYYVDDGHKIASNRWLRQELDEGMHNAFDWSEFIDLSSTAKYEKGDMKPEDYPYVIVTDLSNMQLPRDKDTTVAEASMLGKLYIKHYMSAPYQVLALPDPQIASQKDIPPAGRRYTVKHKDEGRSHRQHHSKHHHDLEKIGSLILELDGTPFKNRGVVNIPEALFEYEPYQQITNLLATEDPLSHLHAISVTDALAKVDKSPKYFHEISIKGDRHRMGDHYDWRFFRGFLSEEEQSYTKERLVRAWAQFADAEGISYWLAHGSMIGWYWNGMTMPWDTDNDIQMPIMELDRLGREFNGTLVLQNPNDDDGKFLIDVSPWIVERGHGNGRNNIDARFIDVENGAYIDITGLAHRKSETKGIGCKNNHFYTYDTLSPMRRTLYEGVAVYINHNFQGLRDEYKKFDKPSYSHWRFSHKLGMWVSGQTCEEQMKGEADTTFKTCIVSDPIPDCDPETTELGTCDSRLLKMQEKLKSRYALHRMQDIRSTDDDTGTPDSKVLELLDQFYPALGYV